MNSTRRSAFTLLELILVLLLMAGVAAFAIQMHFGRPIVTLQNAAELLAEDLEIARSLAAIDETPTRVHFDSTGYTVTDSAGQPLIHPRTGRDFHRDYARDAVFEGVELDLFRTESGDPLLFLPDGQPNSAGEILLSMGDDRRRVHLFADGEVVVERP